MSVPATEIELVLAVDAAGLDRVPELPALAPYRRGEARTEQLVTRYFDSPDGDLARQGYALRVRAKGRKRRQTLKARGDGGSVASITGRSEWSWPVRSTLPALDKLRADTPLETIPDTVDCLFETRITRTLIDLEMPGGARIELALDRGETVAGERNEPISVIEFELLDGPPSALFELARMVRASIPARLADETKAAVGERLLRGGKADWVKARQPDLSPETGLSDGFRQFGLACLGQVLANQRCALTDSDIEGVHQIRVALRRLRAAFSIYRSLIDSADADRFRGELRWLASALGDARDLDVLIHQTMDQPQAGSPAAKAGQALRPVFTRLRLEARDRVIETLSSPRYDALMFDLLAWFETKGWEATASAPQMVWLEGPLVGVVPRWLDKRAEKSKKLGRNLESIAVDARHELRIRIKKLRYIADFAAPLFPRNRTRPYLKLLARMQNALGLMNDLVVTETWLEKARATDMVQREPAYDLAIDVFRDWCRRTHDQAVARLPAAWTRLETAPPFWEE